jgi:hypothetical protein
MTVTLIADTAKQDVELTNRLAGKLRDSLTPSVLWLAQMAHAQAPCGEAVIATIGGTVYAAMQVVTGIDFPTTADADAFRKHLHTILDAALTSAMMATVAGHA